MRHVILTTVTLTAALAAQSVVVPNANAAARGTSGLNTITRGSGNPRTAMLGIDASQLTGIPAGSIINGLSFRSNITVSNPATWPAADTDWTDYEIQIGNAIPVATWTTTLLTNFSGTPVLARDGAMRITTNTFTNDTTLPAPTPNAWGNFYFDLQTPFVYAGGDLAIYLTHPGSNSTSALFFDTVPSAAASGYVSYTGTGFNVATGAAGAFSIVRIHYGYGNGCPGTGGAVPNLVLTNGVTGGGDVIYSLGNCPATTPIVLTIGLGRSQIALPNGCNLLTVPVVTIPAATDVNGRFQLPLNIPANVIGLLQSQAAVVDVGAPGSYTLSNGVELVAN